jgi:hypothetical protein
VSRFEWVSWLWIALKATVVRILSAISDDNAPLIVAPDRVLAGEAAFQSLPATDRRCGQIANRAHRLSGQTTPGDPGHLGLEPLGNAPSRSITAMNSPLKPLITARDV